MMNKSPLRYPGGKHKLTPFLIEILKANDITNGHYIEPYAGGAGAAMELLLSGFVSSVHLNDSSRAIYSFWYSVLNHAEELCNLIKSASLTVEEWQRQKTILKHPNDYTDLELGFSTFFLNRVNRSGVINGGLIGGVGQAGQWKMDARFTRNDLIRRIETIANRRNSITLSNLDAEVYLETGITHLNENSLIYFDPPYYEKASGLYLDFYKKSDHARIANVVQSINNIKWILSYDSAKEIIDLYNERRIFIYDLQYNAAKVYKGKEVFVFCDSLTLPTRSSLPYIDKELVAMNVPVAM